MLTNIVMNIWCCGRICFGRSPPKYVTYLCEGTILKSRQSIELPSMGDCLKQVLLLQAQRRVSAAYKDSHAPIRLDSRLRR